MALPRSSWRLIAFGLVLAVTSLAVATGAPDAAPQSPRTVTVEITLLDDDFVEVDTDPIEVYENDIIEWKSDHAFAVGVQKHKALFGPGLPPQALRGQANVPARARVAATVLDTLRSKYSVAVWDGQKVRILDPEIVVIPPPE